MNHGINVDGLELFYEHYGPQRGYLVGEHKVGRWRGEHTETITLNKNEEIKAIETGIDLRRIMASSIKSPSSRTEEGFRIPAFTGEEKTDQRKTIEAPRVRGIFGRTGALVHALGLSYLALATDAKSREYLLAMEPYLFPDYDYGIIK